MVEEDPEWSTLPGPSDWWPEDFNYAKHGFDIPSDKDGFLEAFLLLQADDPPAEFDLVSPNKHEFRLLPDTLQTMKFLKARGLA
jgi:hypothetical protein